MIPHEETLRRANLVREFIIHLGDGRQENWLRLAVTRYLLHYASSDPIELRHVFELLGIKTNPEQMSNVLRDLDTGIMHIEEICQHRGLLPGDEAADHPLMQLARQADETNCLSRVKRLAEGVEHVLCRWKEGSINGAEFLGSLILLTQRWSSTVDLQAGDVVLVRHEGNDWHGYEAQVVEVTPGGRVVLKATKAPKGVNYFPGQFWYEPEHLRPVSPLILLAREA